MNAEITCVKRGMIITWSGSVASIPTGWALCNGSNGTPDLRNKFLRGAGSTYDPGDTGGSTSHNHPGEDDHNHGIPTGVHVDGGNNKDRYTSTALSVGNTGTKSTVPPYYALAYIMKL